MISDDTAALFMSAPAGPALTATYRMGVLQAFDADDGSNTVSIGTSTLTNKPMLVTGAEIGLEAGDNVLLMYLGNSVMIVGKIASVGGPNYGVANLGRFSSDNTASNFGSPVTGLMPMTFVVPSWAHGVSVEAFSTVSLHNNSTGADAAFAQIQVSRPTEGDLFGTAANNGVAKGVIGALYSQFVFDIGCTPGDTMTITTVLDSGLTWPTDTGADGVTMATCQFYREAF